MADQMLAEYPENATILGIANGRERAAQPSPDRPHAGRRGGAHRGARKRLAALKALDLSDLEQAGASRRGGGARRRTRSPTKAIASGFGDTIELDPNIGFRNTPYVVNQLGGAFIDFPDFLDSRHAVTNEQEALAYADRVDAYAKDIDGETERLAHDRGVGVVAPDFTLDKTIGIIGGGAAEKPDESTVVTSLEKSLAKARLDAKILDRVKQSMATGVLPALQRQLEELEAPSRGRDVRTRACGTSRTATLITAGR